MKAFNGPINSFNVQISEIKVLYLSFLAFLNFISSFSLWLALQEQLNVLNKLREQFFSASSKVRALGQSTKVVLSKLQKVEQDREAVALRYDKMAEDLVDQISVRLHSFILGCSPFTRLSYFHPNGQMLNKPQTTLPSAPIFIERPWILSPRPVKRSKCSAMWFELLFSCHVMVVDASVSYFQVARQKTAQEELAVRPESVRIDSVTSPITLIKPGLFPSILLFSFMRAASSPLFTLFRYPWCYPRPPFELDEWACFSSHFQSEWFERQGNWVSDGFDYSIYCCWQRWQRPPSPCILFQSVAFPCLPIAWLSGSWFLRPFLEAMSPLCIHVSGSYWRDSSTELHQKSRGESTSSLSIPCPFPNTGGRSTGWMQRMRSIRSARKSRESNSSKLTGSWKNLLIWSRDPLCSSCLLLACQKQRCLPHVGSQSVLWIMEYGRRSAHLEGW